MNVLVSVRIPRLLLLIGAMATATPALSAGTHVPAAIFSSASTSQRLVALTFDDGPSAYTPAILTALARFHARATFFLVGKEVAQFAPAVRAELAAGDEIGNHTFTHADLQWLPNNAIDAELTATQDAARAAGGVLPRWFRPPYGAVDARVASVASSLGLRTVLWSVDPRDWSLPGVAAIVSRVLSAVHPGSVVIMHDGGGYRGETVAALPVILAGLQRQGYLFVTLDTLFGLAPPCNLALARRVFAASRVRPRPNHALYRFWQNAYCAGNSLGPAGGQEYPVGRGVVAQDFPSTAHRLLWWRRDDQVRSTIVWAWAIRVFDARGIRPAWHTPITRAWFADFFAGHDWGPALAGARWNGHGQDIQRFQRALAIQSDGTVAWRAAARSEGRASAWSPRSSRPGRRIQILTS